MSYKKVLILNYTGNRSNWGCCATSEGLVKIINASIPNPEIETVPLLDQDIYDEVLKVRYGRELEDVMLNPKLGNEKKLLEIAVKRFDESTINRLKEADLIFFQAEGTMTGQSFYAGIRLLLLPFIAKLIFNKPIISLNQTIFSADKSFVEIIKSVYNLFDIVALREAASLKFVKENGIRDAVLIPDAAFLTEFEDCSLPADFKKESKYFAVTGAAKIEKLPLEVYSGLIRRITEQYNLVPVFLLSTPSDQKLLEYFKNEEYLFFDQKVSYGTVVKIIKNCEFLIGGRYHMCLFSAIASTPFLPLSSNTFKNEGLISLLNYPIEIFDFRKNHEEILIAISNLLKNGKAYKENLKKGKQQVEFQIDKGISFLTEVFSGDETKERARKILKNDKFKDLTSFSGNLTTRKERWDLYFELNDSTTLPEKRASLKKRVIGILKNIPVVSPLLIHCKYWFMEEKYLRNKRKNVTK